MADGYVATFAIGAAVMQLLIYRVPADTSDPRFWRGLDDWRTDWGRFAVRFPPEGLRQWPPQQAMDEVTLRAFERRWGG